MQVISHRKCFFPFFRFFLFVLFMVSFAVQKFLVRSHYFAVVQPVNSVRHFVTPWTAAHQTCLSFTISWSLLRLMSIESMMPSNHCILCHPLLLTSIFSSPRVFSTELALCIRWSRYWSLRFSLSPSNDYLLYFCFYFYYSRR